MKPMLRRTFLAAPAAAVSPPAAASAVRFGVDLFSVRSQGWNAFEHLDHCARWNAKVVHFSEIRCLGSLEDEHLKRVRAHADKLGIELELGMRSICPTSSAFDASQGSAEQQILRMLRAAKIAGSPLVRAFLGTMADRTGRLPIEGHIENTVRVLRSVRSQVLDSGLKIAIENHAGDMQARELKTLIEEAGKDFVGACLDSGNPLWAIEDPHLTLETLAPYTLTSHVRDTAIWREKDAIAVAWVRLGEGNIGIREYARRFQELCPGRAFSLETIVTPARRVKFLEAKFWEAYPRTPARDFARFLALAENGEPRPDPPPPAGKQAAVRRELEDMEASVRFCHQELGI
jgi:sugar phosphate isomerase/epimerase